MHWLQDELLLLFCNGEGLFEAPAASVTEDTGTFSKSPWGCSYFTNCSPVKCMFSFAFTDISPSEDQVHRWPHSSFYTIFFWLRFILEPFVLWRGHALLTVEFCQLVWLWAIHCMYCFVYTCGCLHAVYHDRECSTASVTLRGTVTLAAVVTVEPDDVPAGQ